MARLRRRKVRFYPAKLDAAARHRAGRVSVPRATARCVPAPPPPPPPPPLRDLLRLQIGAHQRLRVRLEVEAQLAGEVEALGGGVVELCEPGAGASGLGGAPIAGPLHQ